MRTLIFKAAFRGQTTWLYTRFWIFYFHSIWSAKPDKQSIRRTFFPVTYPSSPTVFRFISKRAFWLVKSRVTTLVSLKRSRKTLQRSANIEENQTSPENAKARTKGLGIMILEARKSSLNWKTIFEISSQVFIQHIRIMYALYGLHLPAYILSMRIMREMMRTVMEHLQLTRMRLMPLCTLRISYQQGE